MARSLLKAAGGVVYRDGEPGCGPEFLVVHRNRYNDWSLPKGKLDRGESFKEAAMREIEEETGLKCERGEYLGAVTYETQRGRTKVVKYWLTKKRKGKFSPNSEVDKVEWVGLHGAQALLTYNRDARLVERANAVIVNPTATRVYLVRHGNAGVRSKWKRPDKERPLTERGQQQALAVGEILARHPVTSIVSSPAVRCTETLSPLEANTGQLAETTKLLKESTNLKAIYKYLRTVGPGSVVLCTHKDWIGPLVEDLTAKGIKLRGKKRWPKASVWILDLVDGKVVSGFWEGRG